MTTATPTSTSTTTTHREVFIHKAGAADSMSFRDGTAPTAGAGDLTIDVAYSGLNFADIMMRLGMYPDAPKRPFVPGYEVSGVVRAVGKGVTGFAVGDHVMAGCYFGGYAARVTVPAAHVYKLTPGFDLAQAAALPVAFFTAHMALVEMARVRAGDKVLIDCATGGVGTIAMQIAKRAGADVVGLTSSESKKSYIEGYGVRAMTHAEIAADKSVTGFDIILNSGGGKSIQAQRARQGINGRIVCFGVSSAVDDGKRNIFKALGAILAMPKISVMKLFEKNQGVFGLNMLKIMEDPTWVARLTAAMSTIGDLDLKAHVGKVFPATEVAAAHHLLETRGATGKVLLRWN